MTLLEKYDDWCAGNENGFSQEEFIVFGILGNLTDRSGFQQTWWCIDDEVRNEIIETWIGIVSEQTQK